jgi:hypothetical protein
MAKKPRVSAGRTETTVATEVANQAASSHRPASAYASSSAQVRFKIKRTEFGKNLQEAELKIPNHHYRNKGGFHANNLPCHHNGIIRPFRG